MAASDEDCRSSELCENKGWCKAEKGRCVRSRVSQPVDHEAPDTPADHDS